MTLSDRTDLTCCHLNQSTCIFYADSRNISQQNSSCCKLTISGEKLVRGKAEGKHRTTVIVRCEGEDYNKSQNVTITVWRISLSGKYILVLLLILGSLILLSLLLSIIICIIYLIKKQDNQDANSGTVEVQDEKTEITDDELLYATVNHSGAGENSAPVVKFESGTDYATVVVH
ncbi:Protocadherin beta-1 [Labeo rohita]|uniref:Protocadherin beta-1 n=1 Tax=Labeo rohita TaxID=84645 RepID=A0ABQ8LL52_LABRO|nr:Protocadherin beta-1 [Labeo rohita]